VSSRDRLLDLMTARATEGLPAHESDELERALSRQKDFAVDDLDLAAAAVYLAYDAGRTETEPMPETMKRRILAALPPEG
jgi:hypothetical protein